MTGRAARASAIRNQRARAMVVVGTRFSGRQHLEQMATELSLYQAQGGRVAMVSQRRLPVPAR